MRTDPGEIHGRELDLLIIGGGIQGAAIAREAAVRGLSTGLVERDDFAAGTSSRSSRLVHGGVRYLQHGHLSLVREALHERERLLRNAPHLVRPLPVLMPFFTDGGKSPLLLRLGLKLYGWLAGRSTLPAPRGVRADDCAQLFPGIRTRGLRGGALYYDAATQDARLTLAVLQAAAEAGAVLANHLEVVAVRGPVVVLRDRLEDRECEVRARQIVNAAGPSVDQVRTALGIEGDDLVRASRGSHLVLDPIDCETSLACFLPDGRIQFVVPHPDGTLCGTTEVAEVPNGAPRVPDEDVAYLLEALGYLLAEAPGRDDVRFAYAGWRALPAAKGPPGGLNREAFTVEERTAAGQVHTVVGGKLTTHRAFAERVVAGITGDSSPSPTRDTPLPGGDGARDVGDPLWWRHGSRAAEVRAHADADSTLLQPICPHRPFVGAEAVHATDRLGAMTFTDLALRRLVDSRGPCTEDGCLRALHALFARGRDGADFERDRDTLLEELRHGLGATAAGSALCSRGPGR